MLRQLIAWLNKRYPEQVTVTKQDYTELRQEVAQLNLGLQGVNELNLRVVQLEKQIRTLNDAQGFVTQGKTSFRLER
jgi:hypothetical protein